MAAQPPSGGTPPPPPPGSPTYSPDGRWVWDPVANAWRPTAAASSIPFTTSTPLPVPESTLASPARRLGEFLLGFVLLIVTLVIGYIIWSLIAWSHSSTPAKQVLGMKVVDSRTGLPATTGQMWMRQLVWTLVLRVGSAATGGILGVVDALFVFSANHQRILDRMANTLVVRAP